MNCPFCDYAGPSNILYEAEGVFIIEPFCPVVAGHFLAIPRRHVTDAREDPALTGLVFEVATLYAGPEAFNLITSVGLAATQTVLHLHVHCVPRRDGDGLQLPWSKQQQ